MSEIIFFSFVIIIYFAIKICERKKILLDFKKEKHKRFTSKTNNYSIGGIIFFLVTKEYKDIHDYFSILITQRPASSPFRIL